MDKAQDPASPGAESSTADQQPPGLRAQIGALRAALKRLFSAHVDLARAEAGEIAGEIGRVALLAGIALAAVITMIVLLFVGGLLFLGELVLGSIGWGLLLGTLALADGAVLAILVALGIRRGQIARDFLVALVAGVVVALLLVIVHTGGRVGVALGLFVLLVAWPTLGAISAARGGIDVDALKARFYPTQTIETTKETIEWVRERTPLGRKS